MTAIRDDRRPGLKPPRFGLATLMWAIAVLGVLFALISYLGSHATLLLILFALAVVAHVAGNALGTRLRANGDTPLPEREGDRYEPPQTRVPGQGDFAPTTKLHDRGALGLPIAIATAAGVVAGGLLGGALLGLVAQPAPSWPAVLLGAAACGVLGGIWTFIAFGFIQVAGGAVWQATRDPSGRRRPRVPS